MDKKPILLGRVFSGGSVSAGSNFFASGFCVASTTVTGGIVGQLPVGRDGFLWVEYSSASTFALEYILDDGTASILTVLPLSETAATSTAANYSYNFYFPVKGQDIFNFSPSGGATVNLIAVWLIA